GGEVAVRIESEHADVGPLARIAEVEIGLRDVDAPEATLRLLRTGPETCEVRDASGDRGDPNASRLVTTAEYDAPRRVSAALLTDRNDPPYRRALPIALWLLGV